MSLREVLLPVALVLLTTAVIIGCQEKEEECIKIGVAGPHSGDQTSNGLPTINAVELVVEKVNAEGGVLGRQIELIIEDDQCDAGIAANTAAILVSEGVVAVIGHICSGATNAALPTYVAENIPVISPSATEVVLADFPNFFVTIATDLQQAETQVEYMLSELDLESVAILHDKDDYGKGLAEDAKDLLEAAGVAVPVFEGITTGAVDYSAVLNLIDSEGVDAVVYGGCHLEASKLVDQMRNKGMDQIFFSGDRVKNDTFIDVAGDASEGVFATGPRDTSTNPLNIQARQEHVDRYSSEPGAFFMNAYSAILALFSAIEEAGSTEYDAIISALQSSYVDTPLGNLSFDDTGLPIGVGFSVYQVQNGEYVQLQR